MLRHTTKVIATGALGLALSTTTIVPPPQPAVAQSLGQADKTYLENTFKDVLTTALTKAIGDELKKNNDDLAEKVGTKIAEKLGPLLVPNHHVPTPVEHARYIVVERPARLAHRPHWCCRPPPPPPCPPGRGWY
jgi:hypothetical protein